MENEVVRLDSESAASLRYSVETFLDAHCVPEEIDEDNSTQRNFYDEDNGLQLETNSEGSIRFLTKVGSESDEPDELSSVVQLHVTGEDEVQIARYAQANEAHIVFGRAVAESDLARFTLSICSILAEEEPAYV